MTARRIPPSLLIILTAPGLNVAGATIKCDDTSICEAMVRPGSVCVDGFCSNPFQQGCLRSVLGEQEIPYKRVCNSDDPEDAADRGVCHMSQFDYDEIRITNQDWDNPMISTWIVQILLSELLQVPTSIETSAPDRRYNFYDPRGSQDLSAATYPYDALRLAHEVGGDCRKVKAEYEETGEYRACANVMPMVNKIGQRDNIQSLRNDGVINQPKGGGSSDRYRWWIPKRTATEDPSLLSYFGIGGETNRRKLAELFKRPTNWADYCNLISFDNCTSENSVAVRAPIGDEAGKYFVDGLYTGYFRATEKNDCTDNPECTGHIAHVPCSWGNYAVPQAYHLNISVESDGNLEPAGAYGYSSLLEIYSAANATGSNVLMYWWEPDSLIEIYRGTDFELVPIHLPPTTKECTENRVSQEERCSANFEDQVGPQIGSCDTGPVPSAILNVIEECERDEFASCSPAYSALQSYELTNLDIQQIFQYRLQDQNNDGREAVCQWFVENLDVIRDTFIPKTYPREWRNKGLHGEFFDPLTIATLVLAILSTVCVSFCALFSKFFEKTRVMVDFLLFILSGLFLVGVSAILYSIPPSNGVCAARPWFLVVGYSLELIPLAVKLAAINKICNQSRSMKKIKVKKSDLYKVVGGCILVVLTYLATWTAVDAPVSNTKMTLTDEVTDRGNVVVEASGFCASSTNAWQIATFAYLLVLLIITAAIATQNRHIRQEFNEARYLAFMIYSHIMFMVLRLIIYFVREKLASPNAVSAANSILLSMDIFITIGIYFVPKLVEAKRSHDEARKASIPISTGQTSFGRRSSLSEADPQSFTWRINQDSSIRLDGVEQDDNMQAGPRVSWKMDEIGVPDVKEDSSMSSVENEGNNVQTVNGDYVEKGNPEPRVSILKKLSSTGSVVKNDDHIVHGASWKIDARVSACSVENIEHHDVRAENGDHMANGIPERRGSW